MYTLDEVLTFLKHYNNQGLTLANVIEILEYDRALHGKSQPIQSPPRVSREA